MTADGKKSPALSLKSASVLIVEDQNFVRDLLGRLLTSLSIPKVSSARSAEDALYNLESDPNLANVLIVDFELPGMNGVKFIEKLRASAHRQLKEMPVVMLTGHNDLALYRDAARLGISAFLVKPAGPGTLKAALEEALAGRRVTVPRLAVDPQPPSDLTSPRVGEPAAPAPSTAQSESPPQANPVDFKA
jgi:two-component system chemotaxis response regulator CheY